MCCELDVEAFAPRPSNNNNNNNNNINPPPSTKNLTTEQIVALLVIILSGLVLIIIAIKSMSEDKARKGGLKLPVGFRNRSATFCERENRKNIEKRGSFGMLEIVTVPDGKETAL